MYVIKDSKLCNPMRVRTTADRGTLLLVFRCIHGACRGDPRWTDLYSTSGHVDGYLWKPQSMRRYNEDRSALWLRLCPMFPCKFLKDAATCDLQSQQALGEQQASAHMLEHTCSMSGSCGKDNPVLFISISICRTPKDTTACVLEWPANISKPTSPCLLELTCTQHEIRHLQ